MTCIFAFATPAPGVSHETETLALDTHPHLSYISEVKTIDTSTDEARTVAMLRAIAHPARFRIVKLLAARQSCVCGDLVDELPLAQSTVSEHLKVLKDAGIVRGTIDGPNTCYCLEPAALQWLKREFGALSEACC